MSYISVNFPVKPHIKKFLVFKFGDQHTYTSNHILSPMVQSVLSKKTYKKISEFKTPHFYQVNLSEIYIRCFGVNMNYEKLFHFNNEVDNLFREELYHFMVFNKDHFGIQYTKTLQGVLSSMVITEKDIKIETLIKDFNRKKDKTNALNL